MRNDLDFDRGFGCELGSPLLLVKFGDKESKERMGLEP